MPEINHRSCPGCSGNYPLVILKHGKDGTWAKCPKCRTVFDLTKEARKKAELFSKRLCPEKCPAFLDGDIGLRCCLHGHWNETRPSLLPLLGKNARPHRPTSCKAVPKVLKFGKGVDR